MKATTTPPQRNPLMTGTITQLTLTSTRYPDTVLKFDCIVQSSHVFETVLYPYRLLINKGNVHIPDVFSRIVAKAEMNQPVEITFYDHIGTSYEYPTLGFSVHLEPYPVGTIVTFEQDI